MVRPLSIYLICIAMLLKEEFKAKIQARQQFCFLIRTTGEVCNLGPNSWHAAKIVLAAGSPIQRLVSGKGKTHLFCNQQAVLILQQDGRSIEANILGKYIEIIDRGVLWADKGWKNLAHYLDPTCGIGLGPWPDAKFECRDYYKKALCYWQHGNKRKALFFLGAAVHLVQDLCVPHHAKGIAFCGHQEYERWVRKNYFEFSVNKAGIYNVASNPAGWVEINAKIARCYFPYVTPVSSETSYRLATGTLLPLAQRSTAGFFSFFLENCQAK
ncbi:MAG: Phospholipase C precursor [Pelotomaculum sp. PtaB.Bin104]|nr:MAG: Phospholipase C precursor [Pelotomaculum sp. PtaB.Bin104]